MCVCVCVQWQKKKKERKDEKGDTSRERSGQPSIPWRLASQEEMNKPSEIRLE